MPPAVRTTWRTALPLVLLGAIAASHLVLARTTQLNPWLGGGFGMFSTVDARDLEIEVVGDPAARLEVPERLEDAADRAVAMPTRARVEALANALAVESGRPVRVAVWEVRFDRAMQPLTTLLRRAEARGER
jgi:hypothetical protein